MPRTDASIDNLLEDISNDPTILDTLPGEQEENLRGVQTFPKPKGDSVNEQDRDFFHIKEYKEYLDLKKLIPLYKIMLKGAETEEERQKYRSRLQVAENKLMELKEWSTSQTPLDCLERREGNIDSLSLDLEADRQYERLQEVKGTPAEKEAKLHFIRTQVRLAERQEAIAKTMKRYGQAAQEVREERRKKQ